MLNLQKNELRYISRKELYGILETMPFPIILTETDKTIRFANKDALKLGDYDNLTGRKCCDTFCKNQICNCPVTAEQNVLNSKQYFITVTGEKIPVIKKAKPVHFNNNLFFAQFFTDLRPQVQKEEELKKIILEKEAAIKNAGNEFNKFEQLFEGVSEPIFVHDFKGRVIKVNRSACNKLGHTNGELKSMYIQDFVAPEWVNHSKQQ
ncbi:MAG: PAS domain-containing protein, partial [Prolixibacteraceae bacterium]